MAKTKQQMQLMVMAGIVACGALYAFVSFLVMPMFNELKEDRQEIAKIGNSLEDIRRTVRDRASIQSRADESSAALKTQAEMIPLPVLGNYMIGMEEAVRSCAKGLDIEIIGVVSAGDPMQMEGGSGTFKVLQTRCVARSGLHDLAGLFFNIERRYPYVSISGVTISPQEGEPNRHAVNFVVSWLIWSDPSKLPAFIQAGDQENKSP